MCCTGIELGVEDFNSDNVTLIRTVQDYTLGLIIIGKEASTVASCISHLKSMLERVSPYSKLLNR